MITLFSQDEVMDMYVRSQKKDASIKTAVEEARYYGASRHDTAVRIPEKFNIPQDDADNMGRKYW